MSTDNSFKRHFDGQYARTLGLTITPHYPTFDTESFVAEINELVGPLELKDRVRVLARGLKDRLPADYPTAVGILVASLDQQLDDSDGMFNEGWHLMPVARFVEDYGVDFPEESLAAIVEITQRHTGEFAIRPFLRDHFELTYQRFQVWATSENPHVRRLASEGIRLRLPWASRLDVLTNEPQYGLRIVEQLIDDESQYVRTSVANHLNDVSRQDPQLALITARDWLSRSNSPRTEWIVTRGLRSLVKEGNPEALAILGYGTPEDVTASAFTVTPQQVSFPGAITLTAEVMNTSDQTVRAVVDYAVEFVTARGSHSPKVFKWRNLTLQPGQQVTLRKKHQLKPITTRTYYPGSHKIELQINGELAAAVEFDLLVGPRSDTSGSV